MLLFREECLSFQLGSIDTRQTELTPFYFTTNFKFIFFNPVQYYRAEDE